MKRLVRSSAMPITLVTVAVLGVGLLSASAAPSREIVRRLHFDVRFSPFDFVDSAPPAGPSDGDMITSHDRLFLTGGTRAGHDGVSCVFTNAARQEATCTAVFELAGQGTITTQFLNTPPPEKVGAITGGTGRYTGAEGVMRLVEHGDETGEVTFVLTD